MDPQTADDRQAIPTQVDAGAPTSSRSIGDE